MSGFFNILKGGKKVLETVVPKIASNLKTKRAIQDKVVKAVDEGTRKGLGGLPPSQKLKQSMSKTKREASKSLKELSYKYDEIVAKKKKK